MIFPVMILEGLGMGLTEAIMTTLCVVTPALVMAGVIASRVVGTSWQAGGASADTFVRFATQFWHWFAGDPERRPAYDWLLLLLLLWPVLIYLIRLAFS